MFSNKALTTISAFFKVMFSALAKASMSWDLFMPHNSLRVSRRWKSGPLLINPY
jgi:hypothetical protein